MGRYALRRVLVIVPTLLMLVLAIMILEALAPGDPAEQFARLHSTTGQVTNADVARARHELGLDRPFVAQYVSWVEGAVHGDLGQSFTLEKPVVFEIDNHFVATAELAAVAMILTVLLAVPLGVVAAVRRGTLVDHVLRVGSLVVASLPGFFLAYLLIEIFATRLHLLPVAGRSTAGLVLPAVSLAAGGIATASRLMRASLLEVMGEDYIRTARAKGLTVSQVVRRHALPGASLPVITVFGTLLGYLLAGSVIVETIFAWPGLGQLFEQAVTQRDYPTIEGLVALAGTAFLLLNLGVDLAYRLLDPRIRLAER
ncbi:MAG TPA: ABC transporter permease [Acidimicrobiales bacterium]|jgi:peptide/nickel transport system permease protein|nr:ABC transporter permease [Acidimicrobiales bacterium]